MLTRGEARHVAEIQHVVVHEFYDASTFDYDVALLRLRRPWPASLAPLVQPVCLPTPSFSPGPLRPCWVTGWGYRSEGGAWSLGWGEGSHAVTSHRRDPRRLGSIGALGCAGMRL